MATTSPSPTLRDLKDRQIAAAAALERAKAAEAAASAAVSAGREALSLGEIVAKALHVPRNALAKAQERTFQAEALVRALDKAVVAQVEATALAERQAKADRDRHAAAALVYVDRRVATILQRIEAELVDAGQAVAEAHEAVGSYAPGSSAIREGRWSAATGALRSLRILYPAPPPVTAIRTIAINEKEAPNA